MHPIGSGPPRTCGEYRPGGRLVGRGDPELGVRGIIPKARDEGVDDRGLEPGLVGLDQGESGGPGEAPRPEVTKDDVPRPRLRGESVKIHQSLSRVGRRHAGDGLGRKETNSSSRGGERRAGESGRQGRGQQSKSSRKSSERRLS